MNKVLHHFSITDPILTPIVAAAFASNQPIRLNAAVPPEQYFRELASSVVSQQLSVKAAATIWQRFETLASDVTPERILELDSDALREAGVSRQKAGYLQAMAGALLSGDVRLTKLPTMSDAEIIVELTKLKGIGPWTAEMFLIFALGRPDVFSYLDLGLVRAFELAYNKSGATRADMDPIVRTWAPYRTYAALALWKYRDTTIVGS